SIWRGGRSREPWSAWSNSKRRSPTAATDCCATGRTAEATRGRGGGAATWTRKSGRAATPTTSPRPPAPTAESGSPAPAARGGRRLATVRVAAPGMAAEHAGVVLRGEFDPRAARVEGGVFHGPEFTVALTPCKPVAGVVRDAQTKKPLAGVRVAGVADPGPDG